MYAWNDNQSDYESPYSKGQSRSPKGLSNVGNTCYVNSALQVILSNLKSSSSNSGSVIRNLLEIKNGKANMDAFVDLLEGKTGKNLRRQSDASEFIKILFELIEKEDPDFIANFRLKNYKAIQKCYHCKQNTSGRARQNVYMIVLSGKGQDIQEKLKEQLTTKKPSFYCPNCDDMVAEGGEESVTFEAETLIITLPWVYESASRPQISQTLKLGDTTLSLTGMVLHSGSNTGGHYTAVVRSSPSSEWRYCNDSYVSSQKSIDGIGQTKTVLVYSKSKPSSDPQPQPKPAPVTPMTSSTATKGSAKYYVPPRTNPGYQTVTPATATDKEAAKPQKNTSKNADASGKPTLALSVIVGSNQIEAILKNCFKANIPNPVWAANSLAAVKKDLKKNSLYLEDRKVFEDAAWRKKVAGNCKWKKQTRKALAEASEAIASRIKLEQQTAKYNHYSLIIA